MFGAFGGVNEKPFCDDCTVDRLCAWFEAADVWSPDDGIVNDVFGGVLKFRSEWIANSGSIRPTCIFNFSSTSLCCKFGRFCKFGTPMKLPNMLNAWLGPNVEWWLRESTFTKITQTKKERKKIEFCLISWFLLYSVNIIAVIV